MNNSRTMTAMGTEIFFKNFDKLNSILLSICSRKNVVGKPIYRAYDVNHG